MADSDHRSEIRFVQSIEQLERMYHMLADLRARVRPQSDEWFQTMAEGPVEEIRTLQSEIDAYLGVAVAPST